MDEVLLNGKYCLNCKHGQVLIRVIGHWRYALIMCEKHEKNYSPYNKCREWVEK